MRALILSISMLASSCAPVPSVAQQPTPPQPPASSARLPITFLTHPMRCDVEGGCVLISRAAMEEARRQAHEAGMRAAGDGKTCRKDLNV